MPQLTWNDIGDRHFELGVDRGVLYISDGTGVAWNGLTSVKETPSGGDATPYYIDGVKYLNVAARKEFSGVIDAFTYPDEFSQFDGWTDIDNGISVDEQRRASFGLSYRTGLGNDIDGQDHGYKIHLVYNALAAPTQSPYLSMADNADPLVFSWIFTTTPVKSTSNTNLVALSHVVIDSTKTNPTQLRFIEQYLYGMPGYTTLREGYMYVYPGQTPLLPSLEDLFDFFANPMVTLNVQAAPVTGLSSLLDSDSVIGDLRGRLNEGLYVAADSSRLIESSTSGLYTLES